MEAFARIYIFILQNKIIFISCQFATANLSAFPISDDSKYIFVLI